MHGCCCVVYLQLMKKLALVCRGLLEGFSFLISLIETDLILAVIVRRRVQ